MHGDHLRSPYDFQDWLLEAKDATDTVIADHDAGKKIKFESMVWRALRRYITEVFHDKCAYCEVSIEAGAPTQVEHYRPKSAYYWLAYDMSNYVPACAWCNGKKGAKFPLEAGGVRAVNPGDDLDLEKPVLLNPSLDEPEKHLRFEAETENALGGAVQAISTRGEETIDLFKLNRVDLFDKRRKKQKNVRKAVGVLWVAGPAKIRGFRESLKAGEEEWSAAQLAQLRADLNAANG